MSNVSPNPAEQAAQQALETMYACINDGRNFLLEAGAGAGKTYSLVKALKFLIEKKGVSLLSQNQQIACISYTNVASNEIASRLDRHQAIHSSTIHSFCWEIIKSFQPHLRKELPSIDYWAEKLREANTEIATRSINYDELGRAAIKDDVISIRHDDVLLLFIKLMEYEKFRSLLVSRYPILLIDEYQDTDKNLAETLKRHFISARKGPLIGFFGDHWQKIYGSGCGKLEDANLTVIGKKANFRSAPVIVNCLNRIRPDLPQETKDPGASGSVAIYHTNNWVGQRRTGAHWEGDLPADAAHAHLETLKKNLEAQGWSFVPEKTKILMLTHKVLAGELGYGNLADVFEYNDAFTKKEDPYIKFFFDILEPVCIAYSEKRFGKMFAELGRRTPAIGSHADKISWTSDMDKLMELRQRETVGAVIEHLKKTDRPRIATSMETREAELKKIEQNPLPEEPSWVNRVRKLKEVHYREIIAGARFVDEKTPFSTKHGVKGAEFENVLVVIGRGWNQYNFNQFFEWTQDGIPAGKIDTFERNRNLFYVTCSRPMKRLAILFTQKLSDKGMSTLGSWFGPDAIHSL